MKHCSFWRKSWNSCAAGKQPRKELARHKRPTRKEISPAGDRRVHRTERSKLQNWRQREKEASFRGTNWTLCRTTEPTRQRENFFPFSASRKKEELSERKAREQQSAVSFLAVGETRAPFSPPLKCQCICVGNQLIAIRATSTIKIPDTLIIKNAATLHCRAGFLRKGIKLKGATPSVQVQIITTFLKLYKFCNLLTLWESWNNRQFEIGTK